LASASSEPLLEKIRGGSRMGTKMDLKNEDLELELELKINGDSRLSNSNLIVKLTRGAAATPGKNLSHQQIQLCVRLSWVAR
jgi:hypothetical protein